MDWISLVEAAYDLNGDEAAWLQGLVERALPLLDYGHGVTGQIVRNAPADFGVEEVAVHGPPEQVEYVRSSIATAAPEAIDLVYRSGVTAATLSEVAFPHVPGAADAFVRATEGRYRDSLGIVAYTGIDRVVALNTPLAEPRTMTATERRHWTRAAAHVGAGLRLRKTLRAFDLDFDHAEAVLTPEAEVCHARGPAKRETSLERLRQAVQSVELARGRMRRHDSDRALSLWEGLVQGRWSLLDRFDTDGRRYVIAVRNDPQLGDPRGLTSYELQVAELIGLGRPRKEIAFMLGVSPSAINNAVQRATRKLGLTSVSDAAMFFSPNGLRARLKRVDIAGDAFLVGSYGDVGVSRLSRLTDAERDVALQLLSGATNDSIARARGSTVNTIANQIKSVFEKFGVNNRAELAAVLSSEDAGAGPAPPHGLG